MSHHTPVDDESVVCVTPAEGSVNDDLIEIKVDEASIRAHESSTNVDQGSEEGAKNSDETTPAKDDRSAPSSTKSSLRPGARVSNAGSDGVKKIKVGMVCDRKNLYQKWDSHRRFIWTDQYPDDWEEAAENEQTMKYAILVRNAKSFDSRKKLAVDSVVIQSPLLKEVLHDVLGDYPGVTTKLDRLTFNAPFRPFVHRWADFKAALESDEYDETTKAHTKLLYDVLFEELHDVIAAVEDYSKNQVVTYEHVWTIFQPGCTIFTSRFGRPVALKLEQGNYGEHERFGHCFILKASQVDWDGNRFGFDTVQSVLMPFIGTIPITDLDCYPMQFHPDADSVRAELLARGRVFEELAGCNFKAYKGQAVESKAFGLSMVSVEGRIVVDAFAYYKFWAETTRSLKALNRVDVIPAAQSDNYDEPPYYPDFPDRNNGDDLVLQECNSKVPLTEDQLVLCAPTVKGYALKQKKWADFFIDGIEEVVFDEKAFEGLVLPEGHKEMILAFAQSQVRYKDRFDDDISGKGKGMIMLLSGGPGIGKTLTAEAVSEAMKVPLYAMSVGDLGTSSDDVEANLNRVLEVATKWDAVLLLDECDAFLEARNTSDLDRNRIVSIFLRTLEYYQGIMFLTTNRVKHMDEAFQSRIHISLEYPALDRPARRNVWQGFLERSDHEVTEEQIDKLAKLEINGRVIKNVLKTSNLLACHQDKRLDFEHLKTVLKVEGHTV